MHGLVATGGRGAAAHAPVNRLELPLCADRVRRRPWPEVYVRTEDRHASFERAARSFGPTVQAYVDAGYSKSVLPKASVEERVDFIVRELKLTSRSR